MMMQRLFRAAGDLLVSAVRNGVEIGVASAVIIYAYDAYHGHYCVPANSRYAPVRFVETAANDVVNTVIGVSGAVGGPKAAQCPAAHYFNSPGGGPK